MSRLDDLYVTINILKSFTLSPRHSVYSTRSVLPLRFQNFFYFLSLFPINYHELKLNPLQSICVSSYLLFDCFLRIHRKVSWELFAMQSGFIRVKYDNDWKITFVACLSSPLSLSLSFSLREISLR